MSIPFDQSYYDNPENALLIISREEFISKLQGRIAAGKSLLGASVKNDRDLSELSDRYDTWNTFNTDLLKALFTISENEYRKKYKSAHGGMPVLLPTLSGRYTELRYRVAAKLKVLEQLEQLAEIIPSKIDQSTITVQPMAKNQKDISRVFVVHGHDQVSELTVARTLEKLGLNPIILHEQANGGRTVIEKFEHNSNVGFAIVILSADDLGNVKSNPDLNKRARQNVILELGYFIGKLGRDRVMPLYEDGVELPSDLSGLVYVPLDKGGSWRYDLVKELQNAGYNVDANNLTR